MFHFYSSNALSNRETASSFFLFVLACRILAVRIGMAVEKVLFVAVIQFTASYNFRLIALVGFLGEQP